MLLFADFLFSQDVVISEFTVFQVSEFFRRILDLLSNGLVFVRWVPKSLKFLVTVAESQVFRKPSHVLDVYVRCFLIVLMVIIVVRLNKLWVLVFVRVFGNCALRLGSEAAAA